jgi:hypothetical protein
MKCQEFRGWYKKFTRMAPADFELLINLVSLTTVKRHTRFPAANPVQEGLAVIQGGSNMTGTDFFSKS